jgi:uncharacterized protein with von Willebrand factor type A (vWA) domain
MPHTLVANLLVFARLLRASGVTVRAGGVPDAIAALTSIGIRRKSDVRDALRAVLITRHEDIGLFDELFERFWRPWPGQGGAPLPRPMQVPPRSTARVRTLVPGLVSSVHEGGPSSRDERAVSLQIYSANEAWRRKDFAAFTVDDVARAQQAIAKLVWSPGVRVTRRWVAGGKRALDLGRLLRANAKHGGELLTLPYRVRRVAPRPLILICDVSGSMEPYTRMLLLLAHAMSSGERRVEVFLFSTQLTRVTRHFAETRVEAAMEKVRDAVRDWSGGTRIGDAVRRFNADWARRVLRHGPVVLFISDGWDLGDPELLRREIARLQRSSFRLIWLNPLLGSPGYEPLTRGMRAALPFVDDFLPVHDMSSLESLAARLDALSDRRPSRTRSYGITGTLHL